MTVLGLALAAGVLLAPRAAHAQRTPDVGQDVEVPQRSGHATRTFGTTDVTTHRIHAYAFTGQIPADNAHGQMTLGRARYCTSTGCVFGAAVSLPTGARLDGFGLEACNTIANGIIQARFTRVPNNSGGAEVIASIPGATACQVYNTFPAPHTIDNNSNSYFVEVDLFGAADDRTRFQSVLFYYRLQVTPAPAVATFNDVPTNHPFFPFIEALVAAGITTGCNAAPPMYCPDEFVTRKQMAAFLARALGLHWAP
jgi:hypothetical protein